MECVTCVCVWLGGGVGGEGGEWVRELGLGFTNPLGTGAVVGFKYFRNRFHLKY